MSARFTLDQIASMSPAIQKQVMADQERAAASRERALPLAFIGDKHPTPPPLNKTPTMPSKQAKNRIRQNSAGLNKTEQAFKDYLDSKRCYSVLVQAITLKIGNGVRFTVDFITIDPDGRMQGWETKGHLRDDANVKIKVAASLYPWIKFHLVTRKKGEWIIQEVLP